MKSLRCYLSIPLFLLVHIAFAQDNAIQKEIDEQVWLPFIQTFKTFDGAGFNSIHTKDVLRGGPWGIRVGDENLAGNLEGFKAGKEAGEKRSIAFRFEHRVSNGNVAYEVGYYKVQSFRNSEEHTGYGRFDVVLKKVDGKWKIAQDWDVNNINGKAFTEADFLGPAPNPVIYQ